MAPSLFSAAAGTALFAARALATEKTSYKSIVSWGANDFFDHFDFFESKNGTLPNRYDVDPTGGFVKYLKEDDAWDAGLVKYNEKGLPYIGVDSTNHVSADDYYGRPSVRLESKESYGKGLYVFDVEKFPALVDGAWPAIWTYGDWVDSYDNWPRNGDIDIYEGWNQINYNRQTLHTKGDSHACWIKNNAGMSNTMDSYSCNTAESGVFEGKQQYSFQGCSSHEADGTFGRSGGGVYVVEWADDYIKMWSFNQDNVPADIQSGSPDPSQWTVLPTFSTSGGEGSCDVDTLYNDQKIVINLDFCGVAGDLNSYYWQQTQTYKGDSTVSCPNYVGNNPGEFSDFNFVFNSIKIYQKSADSSSSSSSSSSTSSSSSSSSTSSATITSSSASQTSSSSASVSSSVSQTSSSASVSGSASQSSSSASASGSASQSSSSASASGSASQSSSSASSSGSASQSSSSASASGSVSQSSSSVSASVSGSVSGSVTGSATGSASATGSVTGSSSSQSASATYAAGSQDDDECEAEDDDSSSYATASGYPQHGVSSASGSVHPAASASGYPLGNSSVSSYPTANSSASVPYTTSTVYQTNTYTVTSCAPEVTDCPAKIGKVTTEVVPLYTTVCPVTAAQTGAASSSKPATTEVPAGYTASTQYITKVYTVTSCASTVTNCPVGSVTSQVQTTVTLRPITDAAATNAVKTGSSASGYSSSSPAKSADNSTPSKGSDKGSYGSSSSSPAQSSSGAGYYPVKNNGTYQAAGTASASYIVVPTTAVVVAVPSKAANTTALGTSSASTIVAASTSSTPKASATYVSANGAQSVKIGAFGVLFGAVALFAML